MVAAVLGALVGGVLGAVTNNVVALAIKLAGKGYNLWSNSDNDINFIKRELVMIAGAEEDQLTEELRDLALEIEDLLHHILRHVVKRDQGPLHKALGFVDGLQLEAKVKDLKEELKKAHERKSNHHKVDARQLSAAVSTPTGNTYTTKVGPVGIGESKREICKWVLKDVEGEPEQLSVISIVGFSGTGKSTLAKAVYGCRDVIRRFYHRAWVMASKYNGDTKMILTDLFHQLVKGDKVSHSVDVEQLQAKILNYLKKAERYLIVLDDMKNQTWWDHIKYAFPEKGTGKIIVTTTMKRVAKVCCRGNGYVHNMEVLDDSHSKELLKDVLEGHSSGFETVSTSIQKKCDGHPHALVSVANHLLGEDITELVCDELCNNLGSRMATEDAFGELQKVLMNNYRSLPKGFLSLKTCLLYVCVFPNGGNIRRSRLIRRWCAEGYVQYDYPRSTLVVAQDNFKKLIEQSIFWPIDTSKDANVKTFRAHSIFHEFLLYMARSAKFITSFDNEDRREYRHLFIQNTSSGKSGDDEEKFRAHSLTICGSAGKAVGYFGKCQMLRVLDVEECDDLKDEELDGIHELWNLKYLSVGDTITRSPKNIGKLYFLETLNMKKTKNEIILPADIIKLPHLAHLLGRFKLDNNHNWEKSKPEKQVLEKSVLQTLAGFVTDQEPGFQMLMVHMKQLRKVKIWAVRRNLTGEDPDLERAIKNFVQAEQDTGAGRSLSLDISNSSGNILRSIACGCLRSLKLHGELRGLVHFAKLLYSLRELSLSSTNDLTAIDLSDLRELSCLDLECLKLVGVSLGGFVIQCEDFRALRHLCLVQCPNLPIIEKGALPNLLSLRILNQDLDGLSGIEIEWHEFLQEIALDSEVAPRTKAEWKNAARNHQRRPRVLYLKRVSPNATGSMAKYVATKQPLYGASSSIMLRKRPMMATVQPNSFDKPSYDLKHAKREDTSSKQARVADSSPASTELFSASAMEIDRPSSSRVR